jgi:hypothetical protein
MGKPTVHDLDDPLRRCARHHDRVELRRLADRRGDHRGDREILFIEPEELAETVRPPRGLRPPPLKLGGVLQTRRWMNPTNPVQERGDRLEIVEP